MQYITKHPADMQMSTISFDAMQVFLDRKLGLFYPLERKADLESNLSVMAAALGYDDLDLLTKYILESSSPEMLALLTKQLTIGETYFFREPKVLEYFKQTILPQLVLRASAGEKDIHIWSAGCSSGEELHSIAIIINDALGNTSKFPLHLTGTDINPDFLEKAKLGIYRSWSFRTENKELLQNHFSAMGNNTFLLSDRIKNMCSFRNLNLISDEFSSLFKPAGKADVIFCRNVLIYFSDEGRRKIIDKFYDVLADGGYLILSLTEVAHQPDGRFKQIIEDDIIIFKKETGNSAGTKKVYNESPKRRTPASRNPLPRRIYNKPDKSKTIATATVKRDIPEQNQFSPEFIKEAYKNKNYEKVISLGSAYINNLSTGKSDSDSAAEFVYAMVIRAYASSGNIQKALEFSQLAGASLPDSARLTYIHGQLLTAQEKLDDAESCYKRALFLKPAYPAALFALAVSQRRKGEEEEYLKNLEHLLRVSRRLPPGEELEEMEGLTAGGLINLVDSILSKIRKPVENA